MVPEYHLFSCKIIADNGILERILRLRQVRELSDKISRYLSGEFEYEGGSLIFSCSKIEINMKPGEIYTGSFTIEEQSGKDVEGKVYSTNMIVQCLTQQISGAQTEVSYSVQTQEKKSGDVIKGEFHIISDVGEYTVPYVINVMHEFMESSLGNIKNLFHFTNLAKSSWEEAVKLYYHENFSSILTGNDSHFRSLYKGLSVSGNPNENLEEFLIGINKKKAIEYEVDKNVVKLINPDSTSPQMIRISRLGWGYLLLNAKADGNFIRLERRMLTDDDFLGNTCEYHFYINENALHEGNNYGKIEFFHSYGSFCVEVHVVHHMAGKSLHTSRRIKRVMYSLTRYYLDFRMKRLSLQKWLIQTKELLEHYRIIESGGMECSLFEAHLLITQERFNEAKWMLDHAINDPEQLEDTLYCYYLYLTSLYNVDEYYSRQIADRIMSIYHKNKENWRIAWLLLYLLGDINKNAASKWNFALRQIEMGCYSPVFYLEALSILNEEPSLLMHLDEPQMRLLQFGAKMQYLSIELMQQILSIAARTKQYDVRLLRILFMIYERKPQPEALRVICTLLMKGERLDNESHIWYEKGVEENLPLTKLYEYYMMSMDVSREHDIQKKALMYFSYQCELSMEHKAYIYRYVLKNRERLGDLYDAYQPQISRFVVKQLYAGKMNGNLAYMYQEMLMKEMATPDNIQQFASLLFVHKITVNDSAIVNVVVLDDRLQEEMIYPVVNKSAYIKIFSNDHTILLEDARGKRYFGKEDYQIECYFLPRKYTTLLGDYAKDSIEYNLYVCGDNRDTFTVTPKNADRCRYLIKTEKLDREFSKVLYMSLVNYYFEQDERVHLEEMLQEMKPADVLPKYRSDVVKYLSIYGLNEKAYAFTIAYGPENIEAKTIVRFCTNLLEQGEYPDNCEMTHILYSAFERGKYNVLVLEYLIRNYSGLAKNMRNIWKSAVSFDVDAYEICERLLIQTLTTGAYIAEEGEIYEHFSKANMHSDINRAYLAYKSYEYLVHERLVGKFVFEGIERLQEKGNEITDVCMMAYLKFYSQNVSLLSKEQEKICEAFLHILYGEKNILMPFFVEFKNISADAARIANAELIEYKGNPASTVVIHYIINREGQENADYIREEMKNMYGGIFVKEFLLFFGETLQYYVTEAHANKEQLTESGTIQKSDSLSDAVSDRYGLVNDIAVAATLKDYSTARELLEEYAKKEFVAESLFRLQ